MSLSNDDINELDFTVPVPVQLAERLDRACRDRSTERTEVEDDGLALQFAQAKAPAPDARQLEIGRHLARLDTPLLDSRFRVTQKVFGAKVLEVVFVETHLVFQPDEA